MREICSEKDCDLSSPYFPSVGILPGSVMFWANFYYRFRKVRPFGSKSDVNMLKPY